MKINVKYCNRKSAFRSAYEMGVQKALILGYKRVEDARAFCGEYYLESLARKIGACCHNDFRKNHYAIEDYLLYNDMSIEEMIIAVFGEGSPEYWEHCHAFTEEDVYDDYSCGEDSVASIMSDIYEMNGGDGGEIYIGDGTWLSADGSYRCR